MADYCLQPYDSTSNKYLQFIQDSTTGKWVIENPGTLNNAQGYLIYDYDTNSKWGFPIEISGGIELGKSYTISQMSWPYNIFTDPEVSYTKIELDINDTESIITFYDAGTTTEEPITPTYEDSIYYIRGEITSWEALPEYRFKTDGTVHFIENITLSSAFKISDSDWSNNFGARSSSTTDLESLITPDTKTFTYNGYRGGGNLTFTNPHTFSRIEMTNSGVITFTLSDSTVTYPNHLYIYNTTTNTVFKEMIQLQSGVFVYSSNFVAGDYKFISNQDNVNDGIYTNDGLVSSTTSPFYQKYDLIEDDVANTPFTVAEGKYRFKVDLINNVFGITDISSTPSSSSTGYPYLLDASNNKIYLMEEGDSFYSIENVQLENNMRLYGWDDVWGYHYYYTGDSTVIQTDTKYDLTKIKTSDYINFQAKQYKRLEVYLGSSAYLVAYDYEPGEEIPEILPKKLYWRNHDSNAIIEMGKESEGVFTYSEALSGNITYDFVTSNVSPFGDNYRYNSLIEDSTSPFKQKFSIIKNTSDIVFTINNANYEIYNFRVDLNNNTLEVTREESSLTWCIGHFNSDNSTVNISHTFNSINGEIYLENVDITQDFNIVALDNSSYSYMFGYSSVLDVKDFPETMIVNGLSSEYYSNAFKCDTRTTFKKIIIVPSTTIDDYGIPMTVDITFEKATSNPNPTPTTSEKFILGGTEVKKCYLGNTEIKKIYLGSTLLFNK